MNDIRKRAVELRTILEPAFTKETAYSKVIWTKTHPSAGHCACASLILKAMLGGDIRSCRMKGISHQFNRLYIPGGFLDIDITADQFGGLPVQHSVNRPLYNNSRIYKPSLRRGKNTLVDRTICLAQKTNNLVIIESLYRLIKQEANNVCTIWYSP